MKQFDWKTVSSDLLASFGGKDNIKSFMHCATRLRVYVKDDKKVQKANLLQVDLVFKANISAAYTTTQKGGAKAIPTIAKVEKCFVKERLGKEY